MGEIIEAYDNGRVNSQTEDIAGVSYFRLFSVLSNNSISGGR